MTSSRKFTFKTGEDKEEADKAKDGKISHQLCKSTRTATANTGRRMFTYIVKHFMIGVPILFQFPRIALPSDPKSISKNHFELIDASPLNSSAVAARCSSLCRRLGYFKLPNWFICLFHFTDIQLKAKSA